MSAPRAPWTVAVLAVLADGEWHHRDELHTAAAQTIPPGVAYRAGERARRNHRAHTPEQRTRGGNDDTIHRGHTELARNTLRGLLDRGHIERDRDLYRLTPTAEQA